VLKLSPRSPLSVLSLLVGAHLLLAASCGPHGKVVATGLSAPMYATGPTGDARLFIAERAGKIKILENNAVRATPFLDITDRVSQTGEGGLLGLAFSPSYASSGQFFVFYSNAAGQSVLSRFVRSSTDPNQANPASEFPLLAVTPPGTNHKGGTIAFSPVDGFLYLGLGEGGFPQNARDPNSLLGKMLRLNVAGGPTSPYTIPASNPFAAANDGIRNEIWSFGFRNPFRFSFDRANGGLWIGDVGQDDLEEVDYEPAGAGGRDYGWPTHEGTLCYSPAPGYLCDNPANPVRFTFPVYEYPHSDGCAITGGVIPRVPNAYLAGSYVFSDYCSNRVWSLTGGQRVDRTSAISPASPFNGIAAVSEDGLGKVYLVELGGGRVIKLR